MARPHRYEMLPHFHALLALVEQADAPELMFREVVALLVHEAPIIVEAHVVRSADHVEGVTRLAAQGPYGSSTSRSRGCTTSMSGARGVARLVCWSTTRLPQRLYPPAVDLGVRGDSETTCMCRRGTAHRRGPP